MKIVVTNGTLVQIQETVLPDTGYTLPNAITVTGAVADYQSGTGEITLSNIEPFIELAASANKEEEITTKALVTFEALKLLKEQLIRFNLGFVGGVWSSALKYTIGDIVYYNKRLYKCITDVPIGTLPTNNTYWLKLEFIQNEYIITGSSQ